MVKSTYTSAFAGIKSLCSQKVVNCHLKKEVKKNIMRRMMKSFASVEADATWNESEILVWVEDVEGDLLDTYKSEESIDVTPSIVFSNTAWWNFSQIQNEDC